jgi:hypothetical protein
MNGRRHKRVGIADLLPCLNHVCFLDQRLTNSTNMLAEHHGNLLDGRPGLYLAFTGKALSFRRVHAARKGKSTYRMNFHVSKTIITYLA